MDRKLGDLFAEIETLGLTNNTAVVLHSDHGWHLGEHGLWRKFTNFEVSTTLGQEPHPPSPHQGQCADALIKAVGGRFGRLLLVAVISFSGNTSITNANERGRKRT